MVSLLLFVAVSFKLPKNVTDPQSELWDMSEDSYLCYVSSKPQTQWQAHKKYLERPTCETWIEKAKVHVGLGKIKTDQFLATAELFHCTPRIYHAVRWLAQLSDNKVWCKWEPNLQLIYLIRVAGKLLTGNVQSRVKISADPL
ncbi:hypothetical protein AU255_01450 [Methyloprofundus sedimenti]|uniref:Uncharacterized protein n=1 Tax=Methyloprofundus sedimenti TaxID=1420851 RepID=A0A1V8M505_9GAMM|nr:hypothetical protein [Methyloprofundus sedimenti]OQK16598.1 hypothetical protein AU255_01450 [Methyloprofundus sedimenti]